MNAYTALAIPVQHSNEAQTNASGTDEVCFAEAYVVPVSEVKKSQEEDSRESIEFLKEQGFTEGLAKALLENIKISSRFTWLVSFTHTTLISVPFRENFNFSHIICSSIIADQCFNPTVIGS